MLSPQEIAKKKYDKTGRNDIKENIKDEVFTLTVDDQHAKGVVNVPFNFTVSIENVTWSGEQIEVIVSGYV